MKMLLLPLITGRIYIACAAVSLAGLSAAAQSGINPEGSAPPKRYSVVVTLRESEPVKGLLVRADNEVVVVENGSLETRIKTDSVVSIVFQRTDSISPAQGETTQAASPEALAARKILAAMRRLENAVSVGVTLQNYSSLLIENKSVVDENLKDITDEGIKLSLQRTLDDHQYALSIWNLAAANGWAVFFTKQEPGRTLVTRYGYPVKISIWTEVPVMSGLSYVWLSARNRFNGLAIELKRICGPSCG